MKIEKAIMHWVPHKKDEDNPIKLSSKIAQEINKKFWSDIIAESIESNKTFDIENRAEPGQIISQTQYLIQANNQQFVDYTKDMAEYLYSKQNRKNISNGFMVVFTGIDDYNRKFSCILKLEGVEANEATFDEKNDTYNFTDLKNIIFTRKTKVFKMVYVEYDGTTLSRMLAMDDQRTDKEISDFWLYDFLDCKLKDTALNLTKGFFNFIKGFSENERLTPRESIKIKADLFSELSSNKKTISVKKFRDDYIPVELQELFNSEIKRLKIFDKDFPKELDNTLKRKTTVRKFILEDMIEVAIPASVLDEKKLADIKPVGKNKYLNLRAKIVKEK